MAYGTPRKQVSQRLRRLPSIPWLQQRILRLMAVACVDPATPGFSGSAVPLFRPLHLREIASEVQLKTTKNQKRNNRPDLHALLQDLDCLEIRQLELIACSPSNTQLMQHCCHNFAISHTP
jgi:hypothetical protein